MTTEPRVANKATTMGSIIGMQPMTTQIYNKEDQSMMTQSHLRLRLAHLMSSFLHPLLDNTLVILRPICFKHLFPQSAFSPVLQAQVFA